LEALEAENERLRDEIERLQGMLVEGASDHLPVLFRLTGSERRLLGVLMQNERATKQTIMDGLYFVGVDDEPEIKIVDVFVCKIRKKLAPFDIHISTLWGSGYYLTPDMKAKVREYMDLAT
jgi:two-component system cell cycle response regulator CtrA